VDDLNKAGIDISGQRKPSKANQIVSEEEILDKESYKENQDIPALNSVNSIDLDLGREESQKNHIKTVSHNNIGS